MNIKLTLSEVKELKKSVDRLEKIIDGLLDDDEWVRIGENKTTMLNREGKLILEYNKLNNTVRLCESDLNECLVSTLITSYPLEAYK